jgi:hypothetical protein
LAVATRFPPEENAFNVVIALMATIGQDPIRKGYDAVTRSNAVLGNRESMTDDVDANWAGSSQAADSLRALACDFVEATWVPELAEGADQIHEAADRYSLQLARYAGLREFAHSQSEILPHVSAPIPNYGPLVSTHRLALAQRIIDPDPAQAARQLLNTELASARISRS